LLGAILLRSSRIGRLGAALAGREVLAKVVDERTAPLPGEKAYAVWRGELEEVRHRGGPSHCAGMPLR
jgi:hypothetical protein